MINALQVGFIPGVMLGIEWEYEAKFVVIDLFIVRIVWDYWPYGEEK